MKALDTSAMQSQKSPGPFFPGRPVIQPKASDKGPDDIQRECEDCKMEAPSAEETQDDVEEPPVDPGAGTEESIDRKEMPAGSETEATTASGDVESTLRRSKGSGTQLPQDTLQFMQNGFGQDFSQVRIHTGNEATEMNRSLSAQAFTHGSDIYFNQGRYSPHSQEGRHLLAHELTHVVQQTGGQQHAGSVQRRFEDKIGNWAHKEIQEKLRDRDNKLITEAPIPGASRDNKEINIVGFADLYKAEGQTVSGIMAQEPDDSKPLEPQYKYYKYLNMSKPKTLGSKWTKMTSNSPVQYGPKITNNKKDIWDFTPNFPLNFHVGEIKPLFPTEFPESLLYHGTGFLQTGNYRDGFAEFVRRVFKDKGAAHPQLPANITGRPLNLEGNKFPDAINYAKFEEERLKKGSTGILKKDSKQRVWMYKLKDGVYVYFLLPHPYTSDEYPAKQDQQLQKLEPLLKKLRDKRPKMSNTLQKKGEDWKTTAKAWELDRKNWVNATGTGIDKPKEFLKHKAQGPVKKAKVDDKLNITPTDPVLKEQVKNVKKIRYWSSFRGRLMGALRFRFNTVFEKVEGLFEKIKEKFSKHHKGADKLKEKGGIFSNWKKEVTRAIIGFAVVIFKDMISYAFSRFVNCVNSIIEKIVDKYTGYLDEVKQDAMKEVGPACCQVLEFKQKVEEEYQKHEEIISTFTETIETLRQWREILNWVELTVRLTVQALSCGSPPALGCLWGLVAQIGIGTGLKLLAKTDVFENEIAKPAARKLMDTIVGDSLQNFLVGILEQRPELQPYIDGAACKKAVKGEGSSLGMDVAGKLDPNDPKMVKARQEWEAEFEGDIMKDLQQVFENGKQGKVSKEDLLKMVEALKQSKKTPEEWKSLIEKARNPKSGKLNIEKAITFVETGETGDATSTEPTARDIDYEKAAKNNAIYEKQMGWTPFTFLKKPGVSSTSEEFANAVYDTQKALKIKADGIAGPNTTVRFYDANKLKKDAIYTEAERLIKVAKIAELLAVPYPSKTQLIADLGAISWGGIDPGIYYHKEVDKRRVIYGKTSAGARVGAYFKVMEAAFEGKLYWKLIDTSAFTNLDPVPSGDNTGAYLIDLNNKKRAILPSIIVTSSDKDVAIHSDIDFSSNFQGLLIEEIKK